jgi:hypothetical protein
MVCNRAYHGRDLNGDGIGRDALGTPGPLHLASQVSGRALTAHLDQHTQALFDDGTFHRRTARAHRLASRIKRSSMSIFVCIVPYV